MSDTADHVLALEQNRFQAMMQADIETLDRLLSQRLVYTHSHGGRDTKDSYLNALRANEVSYESIDHTTDRVDVVGPVIVITGGMRATVVSQRHGTRLIDTRTTAIWTNDDGPWQLLAFHSTAVPDS
jgi:hypothetical protein